jgi:hypothetical protein
MSAFSVMAMICVGGMQPQDCQPAPGFSRDVAIIGEADNEIECGIRGIQDLAKTKPFRDLADGEFLKVMCMRTGKAVAAIQAMKALDAAKQEGGG